jgi:hypothetical protein
MSRKPIPDDVQNAVLLKSRRRCCMCFWLSGIDEVQKGQIAHLDQNNENADEENLVFLCFNHHDEYDGKTSQSKGLRQDEIRAWRNELYRELENRFRASREKVLRLEVENVGLRIDEDTKGILDDFGLMFRLRNIGQSAVHRPVVSIALPENVEARRDEYMQFPFGGVVKMPNVDIRGFHEIKEDFFEPDGRVARITPLPPLEPTLLPEHSIKFNGLALRFRDYPPGSTITLKSRVDAEDMEPLIGDLVHRIPPGLAQFLQKMED